jgi:hypothetical protein
MTKLEPGERDRFRTRKRWFFLALAVGSALAVLVVGTLFGIVGDGDSASTVVPPTVHAVPPPPAPVEAAPVVAAPAGSVPEAPFRAPPGLKPGQPREVMTHGPDGSTTRSVVSPDGTVLSTTTTRDASN